MWEPCEYLRWQSGFGKRQHLKMPVKGRWQPVHPCWLMLILVSSRGFQIPRSYLSLQEAVLAEQHRRSQNDDVQYLTDRQIELMIEQTPGNDIKDYEDLQTGRSEQTSNFLEIIMCVQVKYSTKSKY